MPTILRQLPTFLRWILCALSFITCLPVAAQNKKQTLNEFFKAQPERSDVSFGPGVFFRADTTHSTGAGDAVTRYYPSGKKYEEVFYTSIFEGRKLDGKQTRWFEDGKVQAQEAYENGGREGELITYYSDGTIRRKEEYHNNKQIKAECFTPTGQPMAYFDYLEFPEYPGGLMGLLTGIQRSINYSKEARRGGYEGRVLISFAVDATGKVQNAHVTQAVAPLLDQEALRVVNTLHGWTPGRLDGEAAAVFFTLPVTFRLQ